jgi:heme-degrading monooxygenase HmoA
VTPTTDEETQMATKAGRALEIVVFKLNEGATREQLLATAGPVSDWAAEQPGFVSRELAYDAEGDRWIDVVWWESMEEAHAAAERAMSSESCAPMFALIDMESTLMVHGEPAIEPVHA